MNSNRNTSPPPTQPLRSALVLTLVAFALGVHAADPKLEPQGKGARMSAKAFFDKLVGRWEGDCRTWFQPDVLADEAKVTGEIASAL